MYDLHLAVDEDGIRLVQYTDQGNVKIGLVTWDTIAIYLKNLEKKDESA